MVRWKPAVWQKKQAQPTNKVEDTVVGGYKKVENAFVDAFLEKVDEPESKDSEKKVIPSRERQVQLKCTCRSLLFLRL